MKDIHGLLLKGDSQLEYCTNLETVFSFVPKEHQLLIKVDFAPVNPSDFYLTRGLYHDKKPYPVIPGFELTGTIEGAGSEEDKQFIGKYVVAVVVLPNYGAYSSYTIVNTKHAIILEEKPDQKTFEYLINPLTAIGLLEAAKNHYSKAIIQNGGSTSVAKLIHFYNKEYKFDTIDIVRNLKHKDELLELGANEVIDSSSDEFTKNLKEIIAKYKPTSCFDCVAGKQTGDLFNNLPPSSIVFVYGLLDLKPIEHIDPSQVIFLNKEIKGFHVLHTFVKAGDFRIYSKQVNDAAKHFQQKQGVKEFNLMDFAKAFDYYPQKQEKLLFKCN